MSSIGIVSGEQLSARRLAQPNRLQFAYTVLDEFTPPLSGEQEELLDIVYYNLPGSPVNLKRTWRGRYAEVDREVAQVIDREFPFNGQVTIHDMAASNAVTSLEFFDLLRARRDVRLHASDLYDRVWVVKLRGTSWQVVFDAEGAPLQFVGKRTVLPADHRKVKVSGLFVRWQQRRLIRRVLSKAQEALTSSDPGRVRAISLFHPRCLAMARADERFTLGRHDLFSREDQTHDVVRLMSTVKSLPEDRIAPLFHAISASVPEGGLLVAGQNRDREQPGQVPTTVFRRRGSRFTAIHDIMGGCDTRDLVLSLDLSRAE